MSEVFEYKNFNPKAKKLINNYIDLGDIVDFIREYSKILKANKEFKSSIEKHIMQHIIEYFVITESPVPVEISLNSHMLFTGQAPDSIYNSEKRRVYELMQAMADIYFSKFSSKDKGLLVRLVQRAAQDRNDHLIEVRGVSDFLGLSNNTYKKGKLKHLPKSFAGVHD